MEQRGGGGGGEISVNRLSIGSLCAQVALEGEGASGMTVPPPPPPRLPFSVVSDLVTSKDPPGRSVHRRVPEICAWEERQNQAILIYY